MRCPTNGDWTESDWLYTGCTYTIYSVLRMEKYNTPCSEWNVLSYVYTYSQ